MDTSTLNRKTSPVRSGERPISTVFPSPNCSDSGLSESTTPRPGSCPLPADLGETRKRCYAGNFTLKKKIGSRLSILKQLLRTWVSIPATDLSSATGPQKPTSGSQRITSWPSAIYLQVNSEPTSLPQQPISVVCSSTTSFQISATHHRNSATYLLTTATYLLTPANYFWTSTIFLCTSTTSLQISVGRR
jgi:hypothetical protein